MSIPFDLAVMATEKKKFFNLVKKLHIYYRDQLNPALISINKFEKSSKYFIRALRVICPVSHEDVPVLTLKMMEDAFTVYKETSPDAASSLDIDSNDVIDNGLAVRSARTRASSSRGENDSVSDHRAHCLIFQTFLKNVHNFRLFRQHVKMNVIGKLRKVPKDVEETNMQKRTLGEIEGLLSVWTTLLDWNNNLVRLVHPGVKKRAEELFDSEQEVAYYSGILSLFPKLTDIMNKFEFALTKYEMSANGI